MLKFAKHPPQQNGGLEDAASSNMELDLAGGATKRHKSGGGRRKRGGGGSDGGGGIFGEFISVLDEEADGLRKCDEEKCVFCRSVVSRVYERMCVRVLACLI